MLRVDEMPPVDAGGARVAPAADADAGAGAVAGEQARA